MTGERKKKVETCAYCGKDSCYAKLQWMVLIGWKA